MESPTDTTSPKRPFATLRGFVRDRATPTVPIERCELCGANLAFEHQHLIESATRKLMCSCQACSLLFSAPGGRFRLVPRDVTALPELLLSDVQWVQLNIPIQLAFFHVTPAGNAVATYPGPAGGTEAPISTDAWKHLCDENPAIGKLEPEVQALLVNRVGTNRLYFLVPIDQCFKLVGLIRTHWRGLSGGTQVWREINAFFASLQTQSTSRRGTRA